MKNDFTRFGKKKKAKVLAKEDTKNNNKKKKSGILPEGWEMLFEEYLLD